MATYTEYPPKGYRVRMSTYWWLGKWAYLKFTLREISSVFVAWFVLETLLQINALISGPAAYTAVPGFLPQSAGDRAQRDQFVLRRVSHLYVVQSGAQGDGRAHGRQARSGNILISGPNFAAWIVVSAILAWLLLRG